MVRAVLALGNPLLWWIGIIALLWLVYASLRYRQFKYAILAVGYLTTWVPWFLYWDRTIFMFYTVVLVPFIALTVAAFLGALWKSFPGQATLSVCARVTAAMFVAYISLSALFFLPLATGALIPHSHWQWRMWLQSWI